MQITRIKPGGWIIILLLLAAVFFGVRSCRTLVASRLPSGSGTAASGGSGLTSAQAANGDIIVSTTGTRSYLINVGAR